MTVPDHTRLPSLKQLLELHFRVVELDAQDANQRTTAAASFKSANAAKEEKRLHPREWVSVAQLLGGGLGSEEKGQLFKEIKLSNDFFETNHSANPERRSKRMRTAGRAAVQLLRDLVKSAAKGEVVANKLADVADLHTCVRLSSQAVDKYEDNVKADLIRRAFGRLKARQLQSLKARQNEQAHLIPTSCDVHDAFVCDAMNVLSSHSLAEPAIGIELSDAEAEDDDAPCNIQGEDTVAELYRDLDERMYRLNQQKAAGRKRHRTESPGTMTTIERVIMRMAESHAGSDAAARGMSLHDVVRGAPGERTAWERPTCESPRVKAPPMSAYDQPDARSLSNSSSGKGGKGPSA